MCPRGLHAELEHTLIPDVSFCDFEWRLSSGATGRSGVAVSIGQRNTLANEAIYEGNIFVSWHPGFNSDWSVTVEYIGILGRELDD